VKLNKKIDIGIIINSQLNFNDSDIEIYKNIFLDQTTRIKTIFFYDEKIINNYFKKNPLNFFLRKLIFFLEKKFNTISRTKELKKIINIIKKTPKKRIDIVNINNSGVDFVLKDYIYKDKVDLIINLNNFAIIGQFNYLAKFGMLNCAIGYNHFRSFPEGFYESFSDKNGYSKILIYVNKKNKNYLLDQGIYDKKIYWALNYSFLNEKKISIFLKNFFLYKKNFLLNKKKLFNIDKNNFFAPGLFQLINYIIFKYFFSYIKNILIKNNNRWFLGLDYRKYFLDFKFNKNLKFEKNANRADPFLIYYKSKKYVFFENIKKNGIGQIAAGEIDQNNCLIDTTIILSKKYNLSYPFVFFYKKNFFLVPETSQKKNIQIYISCKFPYKWKLFKTLFKGESIADPTFVEFNNNLWMFANKSLDKYNDHNSELYIYKVIGLFNKFIPHAKNPVLHDSRLARSAGNFFRSANNNYIRPSQINIHNTYGFGLNLNKIIKLNLKNYLEKKIKSFTPSIKNNFRKVHHLSVNRSNYMFDYKF
jgi:hypothetical protein